MAFTPKNWLDAPSTATPLSADALEDMELRLAGYTDTGLGTMVLSATDPVFALPAAASDVTTALKAAADTAAAAGKILRLPARRYRLDTRLDLMVNNTQLWLDEGAYLDGSTGADNGVIVRFMGAIGNTVNVTGPGTTVPADTFQIDVDAAPTGGLVAGDIVKISSTEVFSAARPDTKSEFRRVASIAGTTITLQEALQDSYTITANTVTLQKLNPVQNSWIQGGEVRGKGTGGGQFGIEARYVDQFICRNVRVNAAAVQGIRVTDSLRFLVDGCTVRQADNTVTGYGITALAEQGRIVNNDCSYCRHAIDISGGSSTVIARRVVVANNIATHGLSAGISTHAGCEGVQIIGNTVDTCGGGIINRAPRTMIIGNRVRGTRTGAVSPMTYGHGILTWETLGAVGVTIADNNVDLGSVADFSAIALGVGDGTAGDVTNTIITGNRLGRFYKHGIHIDVPGNIRNLLIQGNAIDCRGQVGTSGSTASHGIIIVSKSASKTKRAISILGNTIDTPLLDCMRVHGGIDATNETRGLLIADNILHRGGASGINLANDYFGGAITISGNTFPTSDTQINITSFGTPIYTPVANFSSKISVFGNVVAGRAGAFIANSNVEIREAGNGLKVAEGSNAKQGTATLVAGTVTVANTSVTATSRILLTGQDNNVTGALRVSARTAGTSFAITSSVAGDTGVVAYEMFEVS